MWTPGAVRRLIALIAGVAFFAAGLWLIVKGISATGALDIQSALISGKIQTGSAGLIIVFLATFIIIFASVGTDHALYMRDEGAKAVGPSNEPGVFQLSFWTKRCLWVLAALIFVALVCALLIPAVGGGDTAVGGVLSAIVFFCGFGGIFVFFGLLITLFSSDDEDDEPAVKPAAKRSR